MALTRTLKALELNTVQQSLSGSFERDSLTALSQRKLNALAMPLAYIDRQQRYRFANKAFLDWIGKRPDEVLGREVFEVVGREIYQLYQAYIELVDLLTQVINRCHGTGQVDTSKPSGRNIRRRAPRQRPSRPGVMRIPPRRKIVCS